MFSRECLIIKSNDMATFKIQIRKDRQREDKSFIVFIRFSHNRRTTYLPTTMIADKMQRCKKVNNNNNVMPYYTILEECAENTNLQ